MATIGTTVDNSSGGAISSVRNGASIPDTRVEIRNRTPRRDEISSFDISLLSRESIRKRELHEFSVHYSVSTSSWTTRIVSYSTDDNNMRKYLSFSFAKEDVARKFGKAYSPPKAMTGSLRCGCCSAKPGTKARLFNCKNCGVQMCDACSCRWGVRMIPKTYLSSQSNTVLLTVRVCKSCDWLSNAFCMALLQGQYNNAVLIYATGNVNLRSTFASIHKEAMFPIHCAVMGGNLDLVKWLVEANDCPLSVKRPLSMKRSPQSGTLQSVQTSKSRTLMDLAMTGRPKIDILQYLVGKNISVLDTKVAFLASKTLETLMSPGNQSFGLLNFSNNAVATVDDACIICCENHMNCVFAPCGHQVCCSDCGNRLSECPICKQTCSVLRIFKS